MESNIPRIELENEAGSCWTCVKRGLICDGCLPRCGTCAKHRVACRGFGLKITFTDEASFGSKPQPANKRRLKRPRSSRATSCLPEAIDRNEGSPLTLMPWPGLNDKDGFFMHHFLHNICKIALAVDYDRNGYRQLLPLAMEEPALVNGMLAVAASHHSRWQGVKDNDSRMYHRSSTMALSERFRRPELIFTPTTLASMLMLISFEVFSGSNRWQTHYNAIRGWVKAGPRELALEPFLKAWVCLLDTQYSLNFGHLGIPEVAAWLDEPGDSDASMDTIDVLFGCSTKLPRLMRTAAELEHSRSSGLLSTEDLITSADTLQAAIRQARIEDESEPSLGVICQQASDRFSSILPMDKGDLRRRLVATSEIFRHCLHLYVFRVAWGPAVPLSDEMQLSLRTALHLLPIVPDALGPGANLGWCLVVIGSELDLAEERDYIRSRWAGLELLGINNCENGKRGLEAVWIQQDGLQDRIFQARRWQDIMQEQGESQILI